MKRFGYFILLAVFMGACNTNSALPELSAEDKQVIIDRETKTWEYSKTKQLEQLKEILADDYTGYFGTVVMNKRDVIRSLQNTKIASYQLMNIKVKPIAKGVAVMYYLADQNGISGDGIPWFPKVAGAATYVKRNGNWYVVFYQETILDK